MIIVANLTRVMMDAYAADVNRVTMIILVYVVVAG